MKVWGIRPSVRIAVLLTTVLMAVVVTESLPETDTFYWPWFDWPAGPGSPFINLTELLVVVLIVSFGLYIARKQLARPVWQALLVSAMGLVVIHDVHELEFQHEWELLEVSSWLHPARGASEESVHAYSERLETWEQLDEARWLYRMDAKQLEAFFTFRWSRLSDEEKAQVSEYYRSGHRAFVRVMTGENFPVFRRVMGEQFPKFEDRKGRRR